MKLFTIFVTAASQAHAWSSTKATPNETQSVMVAGNPSKYKGIIFLSDPSAPSLVKQSFFDFLESQDASSDLLSIDYHFSKGAAYGIRADKHSVVRVEEDKKKADIFFRKPKKYEIRDLAVAKNGTVFFVAFNAAQAKSYIFKREAKRTKVYKKSSEILWSIALTEDETSFFAISTWSMPQEGKGCMGDIIKLSKHERFLIAPKRIRKYVNKPFKVRASPEGNIVSYWGFSSLEVFDLQTRKANIIKADGEVKGFGIFNNEAYIAVPCTSDGRDTVCFNKQSLATATPALQQK